MSLTVSPVPGFRLGSDHPALAEALRLLYGASVVEEPAEHRLDVEDGILCVNHQPLLRLEGNPVSLVESLVNHWIGSARQRLCLHAGCVRWQGKVWLFPGDRGSGKSTLVAELAARGAEVGSDELVLLEKDSLFPVPKAITLKATHSPLFRPELPCYPDPFRGSLQYWQPERWLSGPLAREGVHIVFPVYDPDAPEGIRLLSPGLATLALVQQCFGGVNPERLRRLVRWAGPGVRQICYRDTESAIRLLESPEPPYPEYPQPWRASPPPPPPRAARFPSPELRKLWNDALVWRGRTPGSAVESFDTVRWLRLAEGHRLQPMVAGLLPGPDGETARRREARRALPDLEATRVVHELCEAWGGEWIGLKGRSWIGPVYESASERAWSDVDLLVRDAQGLADFLRSNGFQTGASPGNPLHLPPLRRTDLSLSVEIHTNLTVPPLDQAAMDWFWAQPPTSRLWAHAALHAMNNPVDSPLLRDLLEFHLLEPHAPSALPAQVERAVLRCRRWITALREGPSAPDALDRLAFRCLEAPAGARRLGDELNARVDRIWLEAQQENRPLPRWRLAWRELRRGLGTKHGSTVTAVDVADGVFLVGDGAVHLLHGLHAQVWRNRSACNAEERRALRALRHAGLAPTPNSTSE